MYHNVLSSDLSGCMHVNSTYEIFQSPTAIMPLMQKAGYRTGGFGKVINGQKREFVPGRGDPIVGGWDWLSVPVSEGDFFTGKFFNKVDNGTHWIEDLNVTDITPGRNGQPLASWYQTSQIGNRSLEFIRDSVKMGKPFMAYLGPHAPHYSADAPPYAQTLYSDMQAPITPAFNASTPKGQKTLHVTQVRNRTREGPVTAARSDCHVSRPQRSFD